MTQPLSSGTGQDLLGRTDEVWTPDAESGQNDDKCAEELKALCEPMADQPSNGGCEMRETMSIVFSVRSGLPAKFKLI